MRQCILSKMSPFQSNARVYKSELPARLSAFCNAFADGLYELDAVRKLVKKLPSKAWQVSSHTADLIAALSGGRRTGNTQICTMQLYKL